MIKASSNEVSYSKVEISPSIIFLQSYIDFFISHTFFSQPAKSKC
jgi:hypothetical protein